MGSSGDAASRFAEEGAAANGDSSTNFVTGGATYYTTGDPTRAEDPRPLPGAGGRVDGSGAIICQVDGAAALRAMHKSGVGASGSIAPCGPLAEDAANGDKVDIRFSCWGGFSTPTDRTCTPGQYAKFPMQNCDLFTGAEVCIASDFLQTQYPEKWEQCQ